MRYKQIHFHLDYVAHYNRMALGLTKNVKNRSPETIEKAKNHHEAKAAEILHAGIKNKIPKRGSYERTEKHINGWYEKILHAGIKNKIPKRGSYERTEKHINGWYEKVTAAKNAKRVALGLEPYRAVGDAKKPRKRRPKRTKTIPGG